MPNFPTFPTLYDECNKISISFLKRYKYLQPGQWRKGTITWSRGEGDYKQIMGQIDISVCMVTGYINFPANEYNETPYLELDYKCNGTPIKYRVQLVSTPSNLGKGVVWFFICPITGKRCRKLYLVGDHFYHRSAFKGGMYEKQTYSHKNRSLMKQCDKVFGVDKAYEQIYSKHFKKHYKGKPTKRYLKLLKKAEYQVSPGELERLYIS